MTSADSVSSTVGHQTQQQRKASVIHPHPLQELGFKNTKSPHLRPLQPTD